MKTWTSADASRERRLLGSLLLGALLSAAVLLSLFIMPTLRRISEMDLNRGKVEHQLVPYVAGQDDLSLSEQVTHERAINRGLQRDLESLRDLYQTFEENELAGHPTNTTEEARIDFKVAALEARERLQALADDNGVSLPDDMGIQEAIDSDEDAAIKRWQLNTVVQLAERLIRLKLPEIEHIKSFLPLTLPRAPEDLLITREFPVRVTVRCSYPQLVQSLDVLLSPEACFTLRRFLAERTDRQQADRLVVSLVCGAGQIGERLPEDVPSLDGAEETGPEPLEEEIFEVMREDLD